MIFFYCSLAISLITIALTIYLLAGLKKIRQLSAQPLLEEQPPVAVIIAMRNEEEELEKALQSVLNLNYNNYRIVVVNDRSTDRTGEILQDFKTRHPQLDMVSITTLPDDWLGKNNALYQGYLNSREEWMLFTDADIEFHPDALSRAMSYAVANKLDHLSILPEVVSRSAILNSVLATFAIMLILHLKPWDAKKAGSKAFVGIGAFNLLRRDAYEKIGTHACIRRRPDDDLQLGLRVKSAGLRQDVLTGLGYIRLEWYKNLGQFGNGLLKNSFSTADYNISRTFASVTFILIAIALPMPVMFVFGSTAIRLMAGAVLLFHIVYMIMVPPNKWWYALMIPFAGLFMAYTFLRAAIITLKQGGIYWRDSFYSLEMLRGKGY
ncbi:MAG: glycosyltransferase [Mucilaginibacter sp.]|nr:glycosyltransferase [Mucilaginibacter sp.]